MNWKFPTIPGTETKLTPETDAPIIPMETIHQGDCLLPVKNASLSVDFRPAIKDINSNRRKYAMIISNILKLLIMYALKQSQK